ncbi:MAG TPA: hypothetical protein DSN98_05360 [Thermoplasmata archaeon]|nr:MAG TPA: hypothetical protein DSN98_05360 [Thermoplasmata archaeon]
MKSKIVGIFVCLLLIAAAVPTVVSMGNGSITITPSSSNELKKAFIFGKYTNLTTESGFITIEAVNLWAIYKAPFSVTHFPRGTPVTFEMYTAYGHMFQKINFLYLHVELVV